MLCRIDLLPQRSQTDILKLLSKRYPHDDPTHDQEFFVPVLIVPCSWLAASPPSLDAPSPQMLLSRPRIGLTLAHGSSAPSTPVTSPISKERRSRSTARCSATPPSQRQADSVERCMSTATVPCHRAQSHLPRRESFHRGLDQAGPLSAETGVHRLPAGYKIGKPAAGKPATKGFALLVDAKGASHLETTNGAMGRPRGRAARPARCRLGGGSTWPG